MSLANKLVSQLEKDNQMKESNIALALTIFVFGVAIFSIWFFPIQGYILAGLVLGTLAVVTGGLLALVTGLLVKEGQ
tara:strand:+ start:280 stop:510 length:231 start_codon:yes stop_codon:yes gene_type:complete